MGSGDIILKGANAVEPDRKLAGIQIANPIFGTSGPILEAVLGRCTFLNCKCNKAKFTEKFKPGVTVDVEA